MRALVITAAAVLGGAVALLSGGTAAGAACPTPPASQAKPWLDPAYTDDCRAKFVVAALPTVAEKTTALTDNNATFAAMGITVGGAQDGPQGDVRGNGASQFPSQVVVGASWDRAMAQRYGDAIGEEFRARNKTGVLSPDGDIVRTWRWGRQSENYGEDPYHQSQLIAPEVAGIQSNHVRATVKHLTAYNQETGRAGQAPTASGPNAPASFANNELIPLKTLNEIYMAPHGAAAEAGASGFMCAFPLINGTYACENAYVMNKMRTQYGFKGSIVPDFPNAQHSVAAALTAGCDACSTTYGGTTLQAEVAAGHVSTATLDQMIYSRVVSSFRIGLTDNPPAGAPNSDDVRSDAHNRVTRVLAADGAVLLKNRHRGLPLSNHARSIAVIGPSASAAPITDISGAGYVPPAAGAVVTPLQGIQDRAPAGTTINYAQGAAPVGQQPGTAELPTLGTDFTATYFGTPDWTGPAVLTQVEHGVRLDGGIPNDAVAPGASNGAGGTIKINGWSVRYTGSFTVPTTGTYVFSIGNGGETRLSIDGAPVAHTNGGQFGYATQVAQRLRAGRVVTVRLDYTPRDAAVGIIPPRQLPLEVAPTIKIGPYVHLGMVGPDTATNGTVASPDALIADAVAKARASDVAVVFVSESEGEGVDRSTMDLPGAQDALVEAVARANRHTIVVLNTGGAVAMPWLDDVKSVLEMWYPGDQFGRAAADLLFGDAEPGGRLPITWPASERQGPGQTPQTWPGVLAPNTTNPNSWTEKFSEGVNVGYRYWDAYHQKPLFPFGYGLSYAKVRYSHLSITRHRDGTRTARVTVTNRARHAGTVVPQLYLHYPTAAGEAPWNLKAFEKLELGPGESRTVSFIVDDRTLRVYDERTDGWKIVHGTYTVAVGSSSRDLREQVRLVP